MTAIRDLAEAIDLAVALSDELVVRGGPRGQPASDLRRAVARFQSNLEAGFRLRTLGPSLAGLFDAALAAGLPATSFRAVRAAATSAKPQGVLAQWTRRSFRRQALVAEARRFASVAFTDRGSVDAARVGLTAAFDELIEDASEVGELDVMRALTALHAAVQRHLSATALPLPRLVSFKTPAPLPSLVLAQRLFADAGRRDELVRGNRVAHPLFMPTSGRALAS